MTTKYFILFTALLSLNANASAPDIQCWGNNMDGQTSVPSGLVANRLDGKVVDVEFGRGFTCVLNDKAKVNCWGVNAGQFLNGLSGVTSFAIGADEFNDRYPMCANTAAGIQCQGVDGTPPTVTSAAVIGVAVSFACALDKDAVTCWGSNPPTLPDFKNPKKISMSSNYVCVLDDDGVKCFQDGNSDLALEQVPTITQPSSIITTIGFACAVDANTKLNCWGNPDNDGLPVIPTLPDVKADTQIVGGEFHICTLTSGVVQCAVSQATLGQDKVPSLSHPTKLFANYSGSQTCALDDSGLVCWGPDSVGQSSLPPFDSVAAGYGNTCVASHGQVQCWGSGSKAINDGLQQLRGKNFKKVEGSYQIQVGLGSNFACGFDITQTANTSCWGDNLNVVSNAPSLQNFSSNFETIPIISTGFSHMCVSALGQSFCSGANDYGQSTPPSGIQISPRPGMISAGGRHTCAIDVNSAVKCWGQNSYKQTDIPKNIKNPRTIAAGFDHTCVIDDSGVVCWGRGDEGQTTVPTTLKNPRLIQAGGFHTCAIDDNGVQCWGDNSFGQTKVPTTLGSKISSLTTGYLHTCAVVK